ncbi:MAG: hypothetical protein K6E50_05600 [Lachnospiraceae bacterium]|nr:hypothetical protein [Lachnospiraceae bacterium]
MRTIPNSLRIILSLRNTININGILYGFRRIPIIGRLISDRIYGVPVVKGLTMIFSVLTEIFKAVCGKLLLFVILFFFSGGVCSFFERPQKIGFLAGFLLLSWISAYFQLFFYPRTETTYAVLHMGMDAKDYVRALMFYKVILVFACNILFGVPAALLAGVDWYAVLLLPFSGVGFIMMRLGMQMLVYKWRADSRRKRGKSMEKLSIEGNVIVSLLILFALFFGGPFAIVAAIAYDAYWAVLLLLALGVPAGLLGLSLIRRFPERLYRTAIVSEKAIRDEIQIRNKNYGKKKTSFAINEAKGDTTGAKGYRLLDSLFMKRHASVLWGRTLLFGIGTALMIALASVYLYFELREFAQPSQSTLRWLFSRHPGLFTMLLFMINTGDNVMYTMYTNCDTTLLSYSFYRKPEALRTMFGLRLVDVFKLNLPPAILLAGFGVVTLALTGGEDYALQYLFTVLEILIALVYFSARGVVRFYLLQPYSGAEKIKNLFTGFLSFLLFIVCTVLLVSGISAVKLTIAGFIFVPVYLLIAGKLVYSLSPKVFKNR